MSRPHTALLPVLLYLALAVPLVAFWSAPGDEGGTFNQAIGPVMLEGTPGETIPFAAIAPILAADDEYGPSDVVEAMQRRGMHPPAYYLLMHLWTRAGGTSPAWLRLPGILLGVLCVLGIWGVTRQLAPRGSAATWAALLLAASLSHLYFSLYLRPYGLELTMLIASLWLLLKLRAERDRRREATLWAGFVAVSLLGLYTLYHYVFVLAWQFAMLLLWALATPKESRKSDLAKLVGAGLCIVVGFVPWLASLSGHLELTASRRFYFQGFPAPETWLANSVMLARQLILGREFVGLGLASPVAELALLTGVILAWPLLRSIPAERQRELRIFWLSVPLLPVSILVADYLRGTHTVFLQKTMLTMLPLAILALAVGACSVSRRRLGSACLAFWLAVLLAASANRVVHAVTRPAWQEQVAAELRSRDRASHGVVFSSRSRRFLHPMLVALRDRGTTQLELSVAGRKQLAEAVERLIRSGAVERISLVSFGDDEGFGPDALQRGVIVARMLGWRRVPTGIPALISLEPMPASAGGRR